MDSSRQGSGAAETRLRAEGAVAVLIEPQAVTRAGLQYMLEEAWPVSRVVAVATAEDVPVEQLTTSVTVLLSTSALSQGVHRLDPLLARPGARLVLFAAGLDRDRLHVAAGLPIDAVLHEEDLSVATLAATLGASGRDIVSVSRNTLRELLLLAADSGLSAPVRPSLSARELDTLQLMAIGLSNRQIAKSMRITEHGVKRHVANILVKLGCHNRTMAVASALRLGLVDVTQRNDG
ncbi:helix-turn-helix transcriptional regulator [Streptomyces sp.]|uniref:helix-turn-helix transcriptional regulator n=1 Tax=Streptomyces sp. TaxID=1931 RepID=UPI002F416509